MKFYKTMPVKIAVLSFIIAGAGVVLIGFLAYRNARSILIKNSLVHLQDSLQRESIRIDTSFKLFNEDILFLSGSSPVKGIMRAIAGRGYDDTGNATESMWRKRLGVLLATVLQERSVYLSIRMILNRNGGKEYVRIDKINGRIHEVNYDKMQQKGKRAYYKATIKLKKGEVYFSPVNLNKEHGSIILPMQPVIRIATPVFDVYGKTAGIMIINADFKKITKFLNFNARNKETNSHYTDIQYIVANNNGDYLVNRNQELIFGFEFNRPHRIQKDYPVENFITGRAKTMELDLDKQNAGLALRKFYFDPLNSHRFLILAAKCPVKSLLKQSHAFRNKLYLILLSVVFLISMLTALLAFVITRPLKKLTMLANDIADGKDMDIPDFGDDEVGVLASSMRTMMKHLISSRIKIQKMADSLEDKVKKRTNDLKVLNRELKNEIIERKKAEQELQLASKYLEITQEALIITDADANILEVNDAFIKMAGYDREEILDQNPRILKSGKHDKKFYENMWGILLDQGYWQGEIWDRRKNGEIYPKWLSISAVTDDNGDIKNYVGLSKDITAIKDTEKKLEDLAHYDPLTGLANRLLFKNRFLHGIAMAERSGIELGLVLLDLDGFKSVNDSLGHPAGDKLLIQVARRLEKSVRKSDTIARLGGDEFALILTGTNRNFIAMTAKKILDILCDPYDIEDHETVISASLGITLFPDDGTDPVVLLKNADTAMYHAKENGKNNMQFFTEEMTMKASARFKIMGDLRRALINNEFIVYYQPKICLKTGRISGMEALVRWQHKGELIPPNDFIPVAEETGIIEDIGKLVLKDACTQAKMWQNDLEGFIVSVNLSARQFNSGTLVEMVDNVLKSTGLNPGLLELEITETVVMQDVTKSAKQLAQLKELGITLSMDDFGTGYSSLAYLKQFPLDILKIDRAFIMDITKNADDLAVVEAIIAMAVQLKKTVIAEGVETNAQAGILRKTQCHQIQGYLVSRPMPAQDFYDFAVKWEKEKYMNFSV